jgi:hypothetical protein
MGRKVNGSNNFPCESAVIQANIKPDPSTEVITAAWTGCFCDHSRRPFMGGRIRKGNASTPF